MPSEINYKPRTEADAVGEIAAKAAEIHRPIIREHDDVLLAIWPASREIHSLEKFDANPRRRRGTAKLEDPVSFAAYVNRFKDLKTLVTGRASETGGQFVAILDHHRGTVAYEDAETKDAKIDNAGWCEHRAEYALEASPEWRRWMAKNKEAFTQEEFALFLEDNADDIYVPEGMGGGWPNALQMMEVALTLQAKTRVNFSSGIRLSDGRHQLTYEEQIESKAGESGNTIIPNKFAIRIRPFKGSAVYALTARLRYRLERGRVSFFYEVDRPHKTIEHAFGELQKQISEAVALPVLNGVFA